MPDLLSSPDGEDFFCKPLETAAKRRKGAGNEVPCWGLGQSPKQGMGWQPHRNPIVTPVSHQKRSSFRAECEAFYD